jgi:Domain of unknown function (DUF4276)
VTDLVYTLVTDGSSDRALLHILDWLLEQSTSRTVQGSWADLQPLRQPPRSLAERIDRALELYACDLLFVHRDAERESRDVRVEEIVGCLQGLERTPPAVCVVPVRMQEAWYLFDEAALRRAAGNPCGIERLALPELQKLEQIADPKRDLHELLRQASGLRPGRRQRFDPASAVHRLAELIEDYSPLRTLPAFKAMEAELQSLLAERNWT